MNGNAELLNFIYQNSQMGVETISQLLTIVEGENFAQHIKFREHLQAQLQVYKEFNRTAEELLNRNGYDEKGLSAMEKIRTYLMINLQTMTDQTPAHIAEMMIVGSNMGIVDAVKNIHRYCGHAEKDIVELMDRLKTFEEDNVERLKTFL